MQTDLRWVHEEQRWPGLAALVRVDVLRYPAQGPPQPQTPRYCLSSQPELTAAQALAAVRGHWAVENQLPRHLETTLGQDAHRLRHERPPKS